MNTKQFLKQLRAAINNRLRQDANRPNNVQSYKPITDQHFQELLTDENVVLDG